HSHPRLWQAEVPEAERRPSLNVDPWPVEGRDGLPGDLARHALHGEVPHQLERYRAARRQRERQAPCLRGDGRPAPGSFGLERDPPEVVVAPLLVAPERTQVDREAGVAGDDPAL